MITKTAVVKKIVCHNRKRYHLTYSLLSEDEFRYGIEVICRYDNITQTERIFMDEKQEDVLRTLYLFAKETVFPIALKETWENL